MKKFDQTKNIIIIQKILCEKKISIFFGQLGSTFNLEYAHENLGGLGPLV
jgi:hypothetical protein